MVDAQRAGVAHVGAQRRDERRIAGILQALRDQRRQAPILPLHVERVGRCADTCAYRVQLLLRPGVGTAAIDRHRKIAVEPDGETATTRMLGGARTLKLGLPLQPGEEVDPVGVLVGKQGDRRRLRIMVRPGPRGPSPHCGIPLEEMRLKRVEERVAPQRVPAGRLERIERRPARLRASARFASRLPVDPFERLQFRRGYPFVIDERR